MIDNYRKKHNNSASLGRTLARTQQHHFSYFAQPKEFQIDLQSLKEPKPSQKKMIKKQLVSTPQISPQKTIPSNTSVIESYMKMQINKQKCTKLGMDVHTATMDKNLRINKMYQQLHHFSICVDELKWLLKEGHNLIEAYLSQVKLLAPTSMHTVDVANISQEFRSLHLRFANIQRNRLRNIEQYLKKDRSQKREYSISNQFYLEQPRDNMQRHQIQAYPQAVSMILSKQRTKNSENKPFFEQNNNYSQALKQNTNTSNLPNFDNIIVKSQQRTTKQLNNKKQLSTIQSIRQKDEALQRQREENNNRLKMQYKKNQELMANNQMLKEQIANFQTKLAKYKVASFKSIEQFSHILKELTGHQNQKERDFSLLKMAQFIKNWQTMIEDEAQQHKYRQIYGDPQVIQMQKAKRLQQIIQLQYEINNLLGQQQHLQKAQTNNRQHQGLDQDLYRILAIQACTLEQVYKF